MHSSSINIRSVTLSDLEYINQVIKAAVMSWNLPERVKRLSLSSYFYTEQDLKHLEIFAAEDEKKNILGVAAWEPADSKDTPAGLTAILLHGIYILPSQHNQGIGQQLFRHVEQLVAEQQCDGLLVKAHEEANDFFIKQGMQQLTVEDSSRQYANRFWKPLNEIMPKQN